MLSMHGTQLRGAYLIELGGYGGNGTGLDIMIHAAHHEHHHAHLAAMRAEKPIHEVQGSDSDSDSEDLSATNRSRSSTTTISSTIVSRRRKLKIRIAVKLQAIHIVVTVVRHGGIVVVSEMPVVILSRRKVPSSSDLLPWQTSRNIDA